jgi:hypothetical protein
MKKPIGATEAATLLRDRFTRLKSPDCKTCKAPVPFWGPGVVTGTGYWYLKMMPPCDYGCSQVISKLWAEMTGEYEIERSAVESGRARFQGAQKDSGTPPPRKRKPVA